MVNGKWDLSSIGQALVDIKEDIGEIKGHVTSHTGQLSVGSGKIGENRVNIKSAHKRLDSHTIRYYWSIGTFVSIAVIVIGVLKYR